MGKQGYQLLTPEAEIRVWGPYRPKNWTGAVARPVTTGYQGDTEPFLILNRADFLLDADFVATRGFLDERRIENAERAARGLDPIKPFVPRTVDLIAKRDDL